jgi:hypothetical protein
MFFVYVTIADLIEDLTFNRKHYDQNRIKNLHILNNFLKFKLIQLNTAVDLEAIPLPI